MKTCPTCKSNHSDHYSHCPLDGTPLVESSLWTDGAVIRGKYRILGKIGQGGMGAVYKAQHVRFKEVCAIKVMAPELMKDPVFLKRFEHEAVLTRKLQHPNAVKVEDFDEAEDGRPFIVMEYIEGRSLKEVIAREAPMPVARVCSIAKQVASALDAAHHLGMVHRDIKPDNIVLLDHLITQSPNDPMTRSSDHPIAKVLDFGIAKMKEGLLETTGIGMTLTGTGMAIGTPSYMSPEQALGKRGDELDGRSDIYSLGAVMYQMLTGELPLQADTPIQMLMAHIQTPPRPVRETRNGAEVPQAIAQLVMQCLSKGQDQRPANLSAFMGTIEYWEQEPARQETQRKRAEDERVARERAEAEWQAQLKAEEESLRKAQAEAQQLLNARRDRERLERECAEAESKRPQVAPSHVEQPLAEGHSGRKLKHEPAGQPFVESKQAVSGQEGASRDQKGRAMTSSEVPVARRATDDLHAAFPVGPTPFPVTAERHLKEGEESLLRRDLPRAISEFGKAIALNPDLARAHHGLGLSHLTRGDLQAAIASFGDAVRIEPSRAASHYHLGLCYQREGDFDRAQAAYRRACELDPMNLEYKQWFSHALRRSAEVR